MENKSNVHYANTQFAHAVVYLRLTLGWPRARIIRYPINLIMGSLGLCFPNFSENLIKLPFVVGTLFFDLKK